MRTPKLPLALVLSSLLVACGGAADQAEEVLGSQASAVQGGSVDTDKANNFAVGIASRFGGVCSGTLIAPNLVLTARHCVVPPDGKDHVTCKDTFGRNVSASAIGVTTSPNLFRASNGFYRASEIITPEDDGFCGNDIALILLEDKIPASEATPATPVVQFKMTDDAKIGPRITAMGYGITNPSANDSGQRRIRENIDILCVPGSKHLTCEGQLAQFVDSDAEFVTEGWVCSGDSGGGAFEQKSYRAGAPYVLGALSRGPQTQDRCLAAIYTRTDSHADMIIAAGLKAAEQGGYDAPEWTRPLSAPGDETIGEGIVECDEDDICTDVSATEPETTRVVKTTTTGCSAAPGQASGGAAALAGLLGLALVVGRRRRR